MPLLYPEDVTGMGHAIKGFPWDDQSHRKRGALANIGDASRNSWFSFSFCYPGLFGFDFEKWDLSYGDLENDWMCRLAADKQSRVLERME